MKIGQRNFGFSLVGGVQQFITNCARPAEFGLPAASEPLLPWHKLSEAFEDGEPNLLQALRWDYGLVETLYGREQDEKAIVDWANGGTRAASVRLVTGAGGAGKTRLGAAVARKLKDEGWTAGFLPQSEAALVRGRREGLVPDPRLSGGAGRTHKGALPEARRMARRALPHPPPPPLAPPVRRMGA